MNFYRSAARSGLVLSSSIALAVHRPAEEGLRLAGGKHRIGQMLELPVLTYTCPLGRHDRLRVLSITDCSRAESVAVLRQARELGISPVTILTHPQEFIKRKDFRYGTLRPNLVNQARLKSLLQFLSQNREEFVVLPISEIRDDGADAAGIKNDSAITVPFGHTLARMLENAVNDRIWWY
jgi:hypothetical protein